MLAECWAYNFRPDMTVKGTECTFVKNATSMIV